MSLKKRLFLLVAFVAVLALGASAPGEAQGRRGGRGRSVVVVGRGYYWADPFWSGYGYPFSPYYQYPFGTYPYPGYYRFDPGSAIRLEVAPKEAEVYVDGYYAGVVDDFDGVFQRLGIEPGEHEVTLYREGLRTVHQRIYVTPRSTFKLKYKMEPLAAGDVAEPRPSQPTPPRDAEAGAQAGPPSGPPPPPGRGPIGRRPPPPPNQRGANSSYGTLAIRVQPTNATVLIDGERWDGPQGQDRLLVDVAEGPHRVEIQREGFESYETTVTVRPGETAPINVSLRSR
ncbi:MAG: PEGA domain-containing protein [Acidobacteriota bacterium]